MSKKKMLVLGSDFGTLQVVREARKRGIYVIVTDLMKTSPTKQAADEAWEISTTDIDALERKCVQERVSAIMFGASDFNINNARQLCKRLQLPIYCENDYAWKVTRDKGEFKKLCKQVGAPVAKDFFLGDAPSDAELEKVAYPVVVKPVDKSGNRGMSYCNSPEELKAGLRYARSVTDSEIIVERRLCGEEFNVHYVLAQGEAKLLYLNATLHEPGQPENMYSFKCTTNRHLKQYLSEVNEKAIEVIRKAGCREGIVWFDCIRDRDGHFYFLEMGYRFGGVMTYVPYEKVTGFNTVSWMVGCALGEKHTPGDMPAIQFFPQAGYAASYHLFSKYSGAIAKLEGLNELAAMENVFVDMPKRENCEVRENACAGLIGIYGKTVQELCRTLEQVNAALCVRNAAGNDMVVRYDDYEHLLADF